MSNKSCFGCKKPSIHDDKILLREGEYFYLGCCGTVQCCENFRTAPGKISTDEEIAADNEERILKAKMFIDRAVAEGLFTGVIGSELTRNDMNEIAGRAGSAFQVWDYDIAKILVPYSVMKMRESGLEPMNADEIHFNLLDCSCLILRTPRYSGYEYSETCPNKCHSVWSLTQGVPITP